MEKVMDQRGLHWKHVDFSGLWHLFHHMVGTQLTELLAVLLPHSSNTSARTRLGTGTTNHGLDRDGPRADEAGAPPFHPHGLNNDALPPQPPTLGLLGFLAFERGWVRSTVAFTEIILPNPVFGQKASARAMISAQILSFVDF
jgi:hypothetical protein